MNHVVVLDLIHQVNAYQDRRSADEGEQGDRLAQRQSRHPCGDQRLQVEVRANVRGFQFL